MGQIGVTFHSDNVRLIGTLFLARGSGPHPTALLLHGVPGIEKNIDLAHSLRENGWNSLIFHYRGSWGSDGDYRIQAIPEDVNSAVDFLRSQPHPLIDTRRQIAIGHSLGGWAAVLAAAADKRLSAVAVYGAVTDPQDIHWSLDTVATEFTPWLKGISPHEFIQQWESLDETFSPVEKIHRLSPRPLLILNGLQDEVVDPCQSQALFARSKPPTTFLTHPDADHSFTWHRPWLREQMLTWINEISI